MSEPLGDLRQVILPVGDVESACAFVADVLGLELRFRDGDRYAAFQAGAITLALAASAQQVVPGRVALAFKTSDVPGVAARLAAENVSIDGPIDAAHERRATFTDSDGNPFVLYEPRA